MTQCDTVYNTVKGVALKNVSCSQMIEMHESRMLTIQPQGEYTYMEQKGRN